MAPRKRKVAVVAPVQSPEKVKFSTAVIQTVLNAQQKETTHSTLINKLKQLYGTVPHDSFMKSFIQVIKRQMEREEANEYANNVFKFCAKYVADPDYSEQAVTHPVMTSMFDWLLNTISSAPLVRFRICQLVNLILNALGSDATLDDSICDKILRYMLERIRDVSAQVRVQAVLALQRLQDPTDPEDCVVRAYTYHLDKDPSPKVRQTVISCLGRNGRLIPHILDRLWDVDERVRRHTYMQMSCYPVRHYKVAQRLKFLEQGLKDHSESVRKVVRNVLLPQWIESYKRDYVAFIEALKLDANEEEMDRFRKTSKTALFEIFDKNGVKEMVKLLNFSEEKKTVPLEELTVERAICWQAMLEYLRKTDSDELEDYMPELSTFCVYLKELIEKPRIAGFMNCTGTGTGPGTNQMSPPGEANGMDALEKLYYRFILLIMLEIATMYDFGDEFGCDNLKLVLSGILCNESLSEMHVRLIMQTFEKLLTDVETRFKFFCDLINSVLEPSRQDVSDSSRMLVETYLEQHPEQTALKLKVRSLRLEILDLKEQENSLVQQKDYAGAQSVADKLNVCNEEYANLVKPLVDEMTTSISSTASDSTTGLVFRESMLKPQRMTSEMINKYLQVCFYLVNSATVRVLTPAVCDLYKSFISRHVQSSDVIMRNWALRASTAFSMLYDGLSKDTFQLLYQQFLDTASTRLWKTAIEGVFELLDRYGFEHFDLETDATDKDSSRTNKSTRQLFNRHSTGYSDDLASNSTTTTTTTTTTCNGNEFYKMSVHFMDTCDDDAICSTIIEGFCRLVLHGHCTSADIVSKLLLRFFNPTTEPKTQQVLGIFFEALIKKKRQELLQKALLQTLFAVLEAPNESPLAEVQPETVVKFIINSTLPVFCNPGVNPHNTIAVTFLRVMHDNLNLKDVLKMLSKQLLVLDIADDPALRNDLANAANGIVQEPSLDPKIVKNLSDFREMMLGKMREPLSFSSSRAPAASVADEVTVDGDGRPVSSKDRAEEDEEEDNEQEQDPDDDDDDEMEANRSSERPRLNKSILLEDSDAELLPSPLKATSQRSAQETTVTASSPPLTQATESPSDAENSSLRSLRRSLCFGSSLPPPAANSTTTGGTFKVPEAPPVRKVRAMPARAKEQKGTTGPKANGAPRGGDDFEIRATQEEVEESDKEEPEEAAADEGVEIPETQPISSPLKGRKSGGVRTTRMTSREKNTGKRSDSSSSSESSSTSQEEVVNGSPNVTTSRIDRSAKPLNKVAAKTLYEKQRGGLNATADTLPRVTRHVSRLEAINGKVMTRKSLSEVTSTGSSPSGRSASSNLQSQQRNNSKASAARPVQSGRGSSSSLNLSTARNESKTNAESREKPTTKKKSIGGNVSSSPQRTKSSGRRSPSPLPARQTRAGLDRNVPVSSSTPNQPKTPTRVSTRTSASSSALSSPGSKRSRELKQSGAAMASSIDSSTPSTSPIRIKRAAVVLTPLSAENTSGIILRRPSRKAARK